MDANLPERLLPLAERIPDGLGIEELDILGPNWAPWAEETGGLVESLFEDAFDDSTQLETLQKLQLKRMTVETALADPRYAPIHPQLYDLRGKLERRLDVYAGLRQALSIEQSAPTPSPFPAFQHALDELESTLIVTPQGPAWIPYYGSEGLNAIVERGRFDESDRELLTKAATRLNETDQLSPEQQEFLGQPMFRSLASAIEQGLASLDTDVEQPARGPIFEHAENFLSAMEAYEASGSREASAKMLAELQAIESLAGPQAGSLTAAFDRHYRSYNLQLSVGETFMQTFFSDQRSESGGVSEYVEDVYVSGCQWTNTVIGVDLKPCDTSAKFTLTIDGNVRSRTIGEVSVATVYNTGVARFRAEKDILFNGQHFTLFPARVGVNASNCTYDAETCMSWVPIAGNIARNIALDKAAEKKPESDAYARRKISREVRNRFDRETAEQFSDAEQKLQADLYGPLEEIDLKPEVMNFMSSEIHLAAQERLMRGDELSASRAPAYAVPMNGLLVQIHQSLLSNGADRMGFAGQKLTQKEVNEKIESRLSRIMKDRPAKVETPPEDPPADETEEQRAERLAKEERDANTRLMFDTVDPISFQFEDGEIIMSLRAGLERPGEEDIPTQIISVPLKLTVEEDQVVMTRGTVSVKPVERPRNIGEQIARAKIMASKIEEGIPERRTQDASKEIKQQGKSVTVQLREIIAEDGWLTLSVE
ncbi:MAG: hypothetical protein KDA75_06875 [Planctomycetaceae bacterium]|nr:hypothetical protein [Planctomycetaceae bacterium]